MKPCTYCGHKNVDKAATCGECGSKLSVAGNPNSERRDTNLNFGGVVCFLSRLKLGKTGFLWAGLHLLISMILAGFCFYMAFGEALSDAYHPDPVILRIAEAILKVFQAPVVFVEWLIARISPGQAVWKPAYSIVLALLWSVLLGYMLRLIGRKIEKLKQPKPNLGD